MFRQEVSDPPGLTSALQCSHCKAVRPRGSDSHRRDEPLPRDPGIEFAYRGRLLLIGWSPWLPLIPALPSPGPFVARSCPALAGEERRRGDVMDRKKLDDLRAKYPADKPDASHHPELRRA